MDKRTILAEVLAGRMTGREVWESVYPRPVFFRLLPDGRYLVGHKEHLTGKEMEELAKIPGVYLIELDDDVGTSDEID